VILSNILHGTRVRLTALHVDDLPALVRWHEDAEFMRLYDARPAHPRTETELDQWLKELHKDKNTCAFAIRPLDGDDLIGTIELDGILWPHGVSGLGIAIGDRANWGQGYGSEAARLALTFAFGELNLHRLSRKAGFSARGRVPRVFAARRQTPRYGPVWAFEPGVGCSWAMRSTC
jgi:RimJ/RimL family protein N-acetyltransferase